LSSWRKVPRPGEPSVPLKTWEKIDLRVASQYPGKKTEKGKTGNCYMRRRAGKKKVVRIFNK